VNELVGGRRKEEVPDLSHQQVSIAVMALTLDIVTTLVFRTWQGFVMYSMRTAFYLLT